MKWPWSRTPPPPGPEDLIRRAVPSLTDPRFLEYFGAYPANFSGVSVTEQSALGLSSVWRAVSLIAGTIASLKASAVQYNDDGTRVEVPSWLDEPYTPMGMTVYEFWETIVLHLLLHGNAFLLHVRDGAGRMVGAVPIHPCSVQVEADPKTLVKEYKVSYVDRPPEELTDLDLTHIPFISTDGIRGLSPITVARNSMGTSIAGERAAASAFSNGMMLSGIATPEDDVHPDQAEEIARQLAASFSGFENAGSIGVLTRRMKFSPMAQTMADAQFLESRRFQVEEVARWFGVPPHLLMQTEKQTSWGSGVAEQNRGLGRTVLGPIVARIEQRVSRLLAPGRRLKFDFAALERPSAEQEVDLLLKQVAGGLMTVNEARAVRDMAPVDGGDVLYQPAGSVGNVDETDNSDEVVPA